jgi:purine nucleosidase/pyrimidine-specific ribonucleoside hydrolase
MRKIILDTDIGDDIDDCFALGLILCSPELELCGITTVFENVQARSQLARTLLAVAGREDIPVAAGCGAMLTSSFNYDINPRKAYLEGSMPNQITSALDEKELSDPDPRHGVDFIIDTINAGEGDIEIVAIGALTNIAMAITKCPEIIAKIPRIVCMGGVFEDENREKKIDWNTLCDPVASEILVGSGIKMDFISLDVTTKVPLLKEDMDRIRACQKPLARKMAEALELWLEKVNARGGTPLMHDPLTVGVLIEPELVKWRIGKVLINTKSSTASHYTFFTQESAGVHRYSYEVDSRRFVEFWLDRVCG